jgi:hypothetical protein
MLVGIDALDGIVLLKVVLDEELEDLHIDRDLRQADEDATGDLLNCDLVEPGMLPDVRDLKTLLWVRVQDVRYEVPRICRYEFWDGILPIQDLLVKVSCVRVFEGQVAADHSK